jgi:hypothetical protein
MQFQPKRRTAASSASRLSSSQSASGIHIRKRAPTLLQGLHFLQIIIGPKEDTFASFFIE